MAHEISVVGYQQVGTDAAGRSCGMRQRSNSDCEWTLLKCQGGTTLTISLERFALGSIDASVQGMPEQPAAAKLGETRALEVSQRAPVGEGTQGNEEEDEQQAQLCRGGRREHVREGGHGVATTGG